MNSLANSRAGRKILLFATAIMMILGIGAFAAAPASATSYPPAEISRTLFINPFNYTTGPAYLPYSSARTIYLTAGNYNWWEEFDPTWTMSLGGAAVGGRSIYLNSNWYYWRCWAQVTQVDSEGDTGVASGCSLTPTDYSTPTATFSIDPNGLWYDYGAGDYHWYSVLTWQNND